jgi:hypothetical protein
VSPPRRRKTSARAKPARSQGRRRSAPARDFWGSVDDEAAASVERIRAVDDPTVLVRSLGPPPLPRHETAAGHYFDVVYEKAANLAVALAAASGLLALDAEDEDDAGDASASRA